MKWLLSVVLWAALSLNVNAQLAGGLQFPGPGTPHSTGGGCAEATAFTSARSGITGNADYTTAICGLVTDGLYAKLDTLYVFGQDTQANSFLSLIQRSGKTYNATDGLGGGISWAVGAAGAGGFSDCCGDYIASYNASTVTTPQFVRDSASIFIWMNGTANQVAGLASGSDTFIYSNNGGSQFFGGINNTATYSCAGTGAASGLFTMTRTGSSTIAGYIDGSGTPVCTATDTSTAVPNTTIAFGRGDGTSTTAQYIVGGSGAGLSGAEVTLLYNRIHVLLQSIAGYP